MWFYHSVMSPDDTDDMANNVEPEKTAPLFQEQSDLAIHCLPRTACPKTWEDHYGNEIELRHL